MGTIDAWQARYGRICSDTLFRTSQAFRSEDSAVLMWLRSAYLVPTWSTRGHGTRATCRIVSRRSGSCRRCGSRSGSCRSCGRCAPRRALRW
ncbi:hypothetical protein AB5I41_24970 [Sphingomonas sp. MMS24-JH45]